MKTPSDYDCKKGDPFLACVGKTTDYIFEVDNVLSNNLDADFLSWYENSNNLLGWKYDGSGQGIAGFKRDSDSFELIWIANSETHIIQFTIRVLTKQ